MPNNDLEQLTEEAKRFRIIFEHSPLGIYTLTKDGVIDSFNPAMLSLAGSNIEKVLGLNALELPSYQEAGLLEYFKEGLKGKSFEVPVVQYKSFTGGITSYRSYSGFPTFNQDNTVDHLLLFVLDVTEKVEIEAARKKAEKLATIVEQSPDAIIASDVEQDRLISFWNKSAEQLFGWKAEEVIGKQTIYVIIPEEEIERTKNYPNRLTKGVIREEVKRKRKDGTIITTDIFLFPHLDSEGKMLEVVGLFRDISERKKFEETLIQRDDELKRMNSFMVNRELKMVELKKEISELKKQLGQ